MIFAHKTEEIISSFFIILVYINSKKLYKNYIKIYINSNFLTHKVYTEMHTRYGKRIDNIFLSMKNKNKTVNIHEYKKIDGMNKLNEILENAFWQIYVNFYISEALLKKQEHTDNRA